MSNNNDVRRLISSAIRRIDAPRQSHQDAIDLINKANARVKKFQTDRDDTQVAWLANAVVGAAIRHQVDNPDVWTDGMRKAFRKVESSFCRTIKMSDFTIGVMYSCEDGNFVQASGLESTQKYFDAYAGYRSVRHDEMSSLSMILED